MDDDNHEVYRRAPVALVATEIAFPGEIGSPMPPAVGRAAAELLGDDWVHEPPPRLPVGVNVLGSAPMSVEVAGMSSSPILRFADRHRGSAIALTSGSVSVETTRYVNWPQFKTALELAVGITEKLLRPTGVIRAGMRYIDEIRVGRDVPQWQEWLSASVMPPAFDAMAASGWEPMTWTGAAQYRIGEDRQLILRYGPQPSQPGFFVNPDGPLRRPGPRPQGPFFLLDFDASWQPQVVPRWDTHIVLETCEQLRRPVRNLFDQILTPRLVDEVFNSEGEEQR